MAARRPVVESPAELLAKLAEKAVQLAKKARKHHQNLARDNFYGNSLARLRTDAANVFRELATSTTGDTTALAELIEAVFSVSPPNRIESARELTYALRTSWKTPASSAPQTSREFFPLTILVQTERGYIVTIGSQMNGCFSQGWYDACAVMMRRLVEISIIEAFEHKGIANKIKGGDGNYLQLSDLVARSLGETSFTLSRNAKTALPHLRDIGHMSAHGRYFLAKKTDIEKVEHACRIVVEEFLHHAGLQ